MKSPVISIVRNSEYQIKSEKEKSYIFCIDEVDQLRTQNVNLPQSVKPGDVFLSSSYANSQYSSIKNYPVILIERQATFDDIIEFQYSQKRLHPNIFPCTPDILVCLKEAGILPQRATCGQTYLASPYGELPYIAIENYESEVMDKKAHHIAMIANKLGACGCSFEINVESQRRCNLSGELEAKITKDFNFSSSLKNSIEEKIRGEISLKAEDQGKIPTIAAYEEAEQYAREHFLINDTSVQQLLNSRNPKLEHTNWRKSCELKVRLCQEINENLDVAASLSAMEDELQLQSGFIGAILYKTEVNLRITYTFPIPD